jgi:motility quorum-sensing regulator/GCU-specific mRNA interferase toxin
VYRTVVLKNVPHHALSGIQTKFADQESLEITSSAIKSANAIGYSLEDIVDVVHALEKSDFVKSETQHSPPNSSVWHDTYKAPMDGMWLYLKFAGETLVDVTLVSFKEV